ncbi:MAG: bifunctional riboflavin kinase/FAD synthetase [Myxococcota bacterium]|nr:bifunctional riboflavin kinase/FAD synthetase [Myxococcota bacterium]
MPTVIAGSAAFPSDGPRPVLTVGNFDGLHLGHRHLIDTLVEHAREQGAPSAVYTFDPPPRVVLSPDGRMPRIQSWTDKVRIMGELGVDQVIVERFTPSFAQHPASWFIDEVLSRRIRPVQLVVGYDFRFGRGREGDVDTVRTALPTVPVHQVEALQLDGDTVSSSRIRTAVGAGQVEAAAALLGCAHRIRGTVVHGDARGRTIGFPTANLQTDAELMPADGVYAVRARTDGGTWRNGVANLGTRPTFDGQGFLMEVHIIDFSGDLYGSEMEVEFIGRIRGEAEFSGRAALIEQIQRDVARARGMLVE